MCPYSLVFTSGMWYAVAHCERAKALRVFRLDRIAYAFLEWDNYEVPKGFSVDQALEQSKSYLANQETEKLRVRYSPRIAKWIAEREGVELEADGSATIEHPLSDDAWAVRHVLQYGPEATVVSPDRIKVAIKQALS